MRRFFEGIRDERVTRANTATRIGSAFLMLLNYLLDPDAPFLRKDKPDSTEHLLKLLAGAVIGEGGQIRLNPDGSISCGKIRVNGSAIFDELIVNRQSANEGDQVYSDRGIIESVEQTDVNQYRLTFRKEYENDRISFKSYDCLKCVINRLDSEGTYYTSWFRVQNLDYENNTADVILYPDNEVPGGENFPPIDGAVVARWGNPVDEDRQQLFFLSATEGVFCFLQGVTKPIIDQDNDGTNTAAFIGLPPQIPQVQQLVQDGILKPDETVLYAKTLLYDRLIHVSIDGVPEYIQREWDTWENDKQYIKGWDENEQNYFQDGVWHESSFWKCVVPEARIGLEPTLTNTDWICVRSGGLNFDIESTEGDGFDGAAPFSTVLIAMISHGDRYLAEDDVENIVWTRETGNDQNDEAWNINQAKKTQSMALTINYDPFNPESSDVPVPFTSSSRVGFRCTLSIKNYGTKTKSYNISI